MSRLSGAYFYSPYTPPWHGQGQIYLLFYIDLIKALICSTFLICNYSKFICKREAIFGGAREKPAKLVTLCKVAVETGRWIKTVRWTIAHCSVDWVRINPANKCVCLALPAGGLLRRTCQIRQRQLTNPLLQIFSPPHASSSLAFYNIFETWDLSERLAVQSALERCDTMTLSADTVIDVAVQTTVCS